MRRHADPLFALFFVSGFSGLIYESVWSHYVKLFLGHAAYAQTLVLIVFIGGLALGSWLCARYSERFANPLRAYAIVELVIGGMALVFHPVFEATIAWGYGTLLPATCDVESPFCATQWGLSALLLAPQSVLLGATFPLMSAAVIRLRETSPGHDIATLYFLNSLGAVLGVLASAFLLIPGLGLPGTLMTAGLANLAIAAGAWALSSAPQPAFVPAVARDALAPAPGEGRRLLPLLLATALLTGLSSFVYEIAWIRMLGLVLGASTHAFELMLASFILGLALGGLWIRNRVDHSTDPVRFLGVVQLVMGVAAAITLPVYAGAFDVMAWILDAVSRTSGGFVLFNVGSTAIALLVMLPATFCAGMTLPLITFRLLRSPTGEKAIGMVYAVNTLGAILGVVLAVHVLMDTLGLKGTILVGAAIDVVLGVVLIAATRAPGTRRIPLAIPIGVAVAALAVLAVGFELDPRRTASGVFRSGAARLTAGDKIVYHRDGKTATVDVVDHGRVRAIRTNGKSDAAIGLGEIPASDEYTMALLAILPLGHRPEARTAAVIGFGSGMSTATLLASPRLERVDTIEIEPAMVEGARLFRPMVEAAYSDPRSRIVIDDAKSYFARTGEKYDIIVSEPSNPWISGVASLFTEEFYRRLHAHLEDGGVLAQWIHTYDMDTTTLASILRAISGTFPDFVVYSIDADVIVIARKGGAPGAFRDEVLRIENLQSLLRRLNLLNGEDVRRRSAGSWSTLGPYFNRLGAPANSDYFPLVDQRAGRTRFTRERVTDLLDLMNAKVPVLEMLDPAAHPPARERTAPRVAGSDWDLRTVWAVQDILEAREPAQAPAAMAPMEASARLARLWAAHCRTEASYPQALPHLLTLAREATPHLHPDAARAAWSRIADTPCARALSPEERVWLELFTATAARDGASMARAGMRILETDRASRNLGSEYAFTATLAGLLCLGDHERARTLLAEGTRHWLRPGAAGTELAYLHGIAAGPARPPRCRAG